MIDSLFALYLIYIIIDPQVFQLLQYIYLNINQSPDKKVVDLFMTSQSKVIPMGNKTLNAKSLKQSVYQQVSSNPTKPRFKPGDSNQVYVYMGTYNITPEPL